MCKIAGMTRFNPETMEQVIGDVWKAMAKTESDGYGAAWTDTTGGISWVKSSIPEWPTGELSYPDFCDLFADGEICGEPDGRYLIIHGRTATSDVILENTHPMMHQSRKRTLMLIHNGVVDSMDYEMKETSCDSELLVQAYLKDGFEGIEDGIEGYYAFMMIEMKGKRPSFHVCRDSKADLECGLFEGQWCFATTKDLIYKMGASPVCRYADDRYAVFTPAKKEPLVRAFSPRVRTLVGATRAFGYQDSYDEADAYADAYDGGRYSGKTYRHWQDKWEKEKKERSAKAYADAQKASKTAWTPKNKIIPPKPVTPAKPKATDPLPKEISNSAELRAELDRRLKVEGPASVQAEIERLRLSGVKAAAEHTSKTNK